MELYAVEGNVVKLNVIIIMTFIKDIALQCFHYNMFAL